MITELHDLTKITTPFGLLDRETQERLKAHGGPYEVFGGGGWYEIFIRRDWVSRSTYRVKPVPVVEYKEVTVDSPNTLFQYIITEKFVDGKYQSYNITMVPF